MKIKLERILIEFGGAITAFFAIIELVKYSLGIFLVKCLADITLPLLEDYKILHELAGLAYILALLLLVILAVISLIVGVYGFKLYSAGAKLSRETAEKWLVKTMLIAVISLFFGAFIVTAASSIALLGVLIVLAKKED
ncbi:MAG: hypothetical protein DRJ37_07045 [Thermoprotei archaeon]|nr:MAG: hypothetical protein DRJ37_07045 [Thermoprotei archaeon]